MDKMFKGVKDKYLDLTGVDTSAAVYMQNMFMSSEPETIILDGWDVRNVKYMTQFFEDANIKTIDLSSFDLQNVEEMINFCAEADNLVSFDSSSWPNFKPKKSGVRLDSFFSGCSRLEYADLTGFDGYKITSDYSSYANGIFMYCYNLKKVNLDGAFDVSDAGSNFNSLFYYCISLEEADISSLGNIPLGSQSSMFSNCPSLKKLVATNVDIWDCYMGRNLVSLNTVVIGGGMVFEDGITLDNVREECFGTGYWGTSGGSDKVTGEYVTYEYNKDKIEGINAFFTEVKDGDMYVYYLPKEGETTQKVTVQKDGATINVDLLEHPEYYVIEDVSGDEVITIQFGPTVTVTFMDSVDDAELDKVLIPKGDAVTAPEAPAHEGVEFLYWATEKNGETKADLTAVNADMTVWAVYGVPFKPTVTVTSTGAGTATPEGETVVEDGADLDITITPDNDRITYTVTVNGTKVDASEITAGVLALTDIQEDKDVVVTFTGTAITGAPKVVFEKSSKTYDIDEEIKFEAVGFWADNETTDFISGDERYVPLRWHHADPSGDFGGKTAPTDDYTDSFTQSEAGKYVLKVEFTKYVFNGTDWAEDGVVTVEAPYTVKGEVLGESDTPDTGDNGIGMQIAISLMALSICGVVACVMWKKRSKKAEQE